MHLSFHCEDLTPPYRKLLPSHQSIIRHRCHSSVLTRQISLRSGQKGPNCFLGSLFSSGLAWGLYHAHYESFTKSHLKHFLVWTSTQTTTIIIILIEIEIKIKILRKVISEFDVLISYVDFPKIHSMSNFKFKDRKIVLIKGHVGSDKNFKRHSF